MSIIVSLVMCLMAVPMNTAASKTESSSARAMGDVDDDKKIAASDAALVLSEYGRLSMGSEGIFSEDVRTVALRPNVTYYLEQTDDGEYDVYAAKSAKFELLLEEAGY